MNVLSAVLDTLIAVIFVIPLQQRRTGIRQYAFAVYIFPISHLHGCRSEKLIKTLVSLTNNQLVKSNL